MKKINEFNSRVKLQCDYNVDVLKKSFDLGNALEWDKWIGKIPVINFDPEWKIKIVPPFNGAMVRFHVINSNGHSISVYLDCHNILGSIIYSLVESGICPYWEIYPYENDVKRVEMNNVQELLESIRKAFKFMEESKDSPK